MMLKGNFDLMNLRMFLKMRRQIEFLKLFSSETPELGKHLLYSDFVMTLLENHLVRQ
jgi:hypothetical protein